MPLLDRRSKAVYDTTAIASYANIAETHEEACLITHMGGKVPISLSALD